MSNTIKISEWYNNNVLTEHGRLVDGKLEFIITLRTIVNSFPNDTPLRIADVGGGTGRYAVELAKLGHKVALIDISQAELDLAAQHAEANNVTLEAFICADASTLRKTLPNSAELLFDAVLIFGPLYHLLEKHERLATVSNCAALLKPNGIIAASFLTKFGHLRGVARNDSGRVAREETFYQKYLEDGKYDRKRDVFSHHTHPDEIHKLFGEVTEFELRVEKLVACESFLGSELAAGLNKLDENEYQAWEKILLRFAEDPYVLGASEHILVIGRRA